MRGQFDLRNPCASVADFLSVHPSELSLIPRVLGSDCRPIAIKSEPTEGDKFDNLNLSRTRSALLVSESKQLLKEIDI